LINSKFSIRGATDSKVLIKPSNRLDESLLLSILLSRDLEIGTNRESVLGATVKGDLVWLLGLDKDLLCLVTLLSWEDLVNFSGGNVEGSVYGSEFFLLNESKIRSE
jgi:hypothetical protein